MKIGYQGTKGSYNYFAAIEFSKQFNSEDIEFVPLIDSQNVVNSLNARQIDYGIVAFQNSIAGIVRESYEALRTEAFEHVDTIISQINHCLFIKIESRLEDITKVISHEMALKQCALYLGEKVPHAQIQSVKDTASAASLVAKGNSNIHTAVICSKEAGNQNNLKLEDEGIQDNIENFTEFRVYKIRELKESIPLKFKMLSLLYSDDKPELIVNIAIVLIIFALLILFTSMYQGQNAWGAASFFGGIISTITMLLSSKKLRNKYSNSFIKGYFIYQAISDSNELTTSQRHSIPRVAKILEEDGKLKIHIYIADKAALVFAQSIYVIHSNLSNKSGKLTYAYEKGDQTTSTINFKGIVYMSWQKTKKWSKIMDLSARYLSELSNDTGSVHYHRISKTEFERIKNFNYVNTSHIKIT